MGWGSSLATALGAPPVPVQRQMAQGAHQGCTTDSSVMLRREVSAYRTRLLHELDGFLSLSERDRAALGDVQRRRTEGISEAVRQAEHFADLFYTRSRRREYLTVERVTAGSCSAMGYCNMHDLMIQLVRDWGSDNENVRRSQHELVLAAVRDHAAARPAAAAGAGGAEGEADAAAAPPLGRCLVPGDALCRLSYDLSSTGLFSELVACDASPLFVDCADYILNGCHEPFTVTPHAGVFSNQLSVAGHLRQCVVPTPWPLAQPPAPLRLQVGTFDELMVDGLGRHDAGSFGVIATCFFIDTVPGSVLKAVDAVARLLAPGGLWVNSGPLLYRKDTAPKLSWEELRILIEVRGLRIQRDEGIMPAEYCEKIETSLHPTIYHPRFFTAIRAADDDEMVCQPCPPAPDGSGGGAGHGGGHGAAPDAGAGASAGGGWWPRWPGGGSAL